MFKINGMQILYPNNFTMQKETNIVAELKTLDGGIIGDIRGWKYSDAIFQWGMLPESQLRSLLTATVGMFTVSFDDVDGTEKTVNTIKTSVVSTRRREVKNGKPVFVDIQMGVSFPDAYAD